jgi:hypothetical protein
VIFSGQYEPLKHLSSISEVGQKKPAAQSFIDVRLAGQYDPVPHNSLIDGSIQK